MYGASPTPAATLPADATAIENTACSLCRGSLGAEIVAAIERSPLMGQCPPTFSSVGRAISFPPARALGGDWVGRVLERTRARVPRPEGSPASGDAGPVGGNAAIAALPEECRRASICHKLSRNGLIGLAGPTLTLFVTSSQEHQNKVCRHGLSGCLAG